MEHRDRAADGPLPRLRQLLLQKYRHLFWLLFWPAFGLAFHFCENIFAPHRWYIMHCALDDVIPFCEWFIFPYMFWFVYLVFMHAYTGLFDPPAFRKMMHFIVLTYSVALVVFLIFPTAQELRPTVFLRDNILTRFIALFYRLDTNTNVCPSLHVVGSMAVMFAAWDTPRFQSRRWKTAFGCATALICISTVFLKQHSVIDVIAGLALSLVGYHLAYRGGLERITALVARQREHFKRIYG